MPLKSSLEWPDNRQVVRVSVLPLQTSPASKPWHHQRRKLEHGNQPLTMSQSTPSLLTNLRPPVSASAPHLPAPSKCWCQGDCNHITQRASHSPAPPCNFDGLSFRWGPGIGMFSKFPGWSRPAARCGNHWTPGRWYLKHLPTLWTYEMSLSPLRAAWQQPHVPGITKCIPNVGENRDIGLYCTSEVTRMDFDDHLKSRPNGCGCHPREKGFGSCLSG